MADNNKAYNLSVRDDTTFRVEGGETVENNTVIVTAIEEYSDELSTEVYVPDIPIADIYDLILSGKIVVIRTEGVFRREYHLSEFYSPNDSSAGRMAFINTYVGSGTEKVEYRVLRRNNLNVNYFLYEVFTADVVTD